MAIRSDWTLAYEYDEQDEERINEIINDANAIAEDALGKFFEEHGIDIRFSIDWDGDLDVEEGSLLREIGLDPIEQRDRDLRINQQESGGNSFVRRILNQ